jgi:hypothetical protein
VKVTTISVKVAKMFSDGNYGHQECEVSYTAEVGEHEDSEMVAVVLAARATAQVRVQLGESETLNIRRAVNPRPRVCGHCQQALGDWDQYSHKACEEEQRAERDEVRAQQLRNRQAVEDGRARWNADGEIEWLDGSDLSEQEVEWLPAGAVE